MPIHLDANGYTSDFQSFVDFAQQRKDENDAKAIANYKVSNLGGRKTVAIQKSQTDEVHKWLRTVREWSANDSTRSVFKDAIVKMFGGESKIPASVKKAMLLEDYDCGKPLTARRILAVREAIDACGIPRQRAEKMRLETFDSAEVKAAALAKGYAKAELPKLARAVHFYIQVNGGTEAEALETVSNPTTKAHRLMNYGGRFLESVENFQNGMNLIDSFAAWFENTCQAVSSKGRHDPFVEGDSATLLNAKKEPFSTKSLLAMEKFIFEEIASNARYNLAEQDPEAIFGMANNLATHFFGLGLGNGAVHTMANIPPAKRPVVYAAMSLAFPLDQTAAQANVPKRDRRNYINDKERTKFIARILKNLDTLSAYHAKGRLTLKNFVKTCFPEAREATIAGLSNLCKRWDREFDGDNGVAARYEPQYENQMLNIMGETGCTIEEAYEAARGGKRPPMPKYVSSGTLPLSSFNGTTKEARDEFKGDVTRATNYTLVDGGQPLIPADLGFRINFPDGQSFLTTSADRLSDPGQAKLDSIADKIETLCGGVHRAQASSVMMMLTQSASGALCKGLLGYGIISNEHSALDYTLSKNAQTGAVTITYRSPSELPFRFEWTATIGIDGSVSTTPMVFEKPVENLTAADAKKILGRAAAKLGVKPGRAELNAAAALLIQHGTGMFRKNIDIFASFILRQPLVGNKAANSALRIADIAPSIRAWRDFPLGENRHQELARTIARNHNNTIGECFRDETKFHSENGKRTPIFETFYQDTHRNTYVINGQVFKSGTVTNVQQRLAQIVAALKKALPAEKAQKVISSLMNQSGPCDILLLRSRTPVQGPDGVVNLHDLPGASMLLNHKMDGELFPVQIYDASMRFDLDVSKDGRTATLLITLDAKLEGGVGQRQLADPDATKFGKARIRERITIDLEPEIPVVTDVALGQELL